MKGKALSVLFCIALASLGRSAAQEPAPKGSPGGSLQVLDENLNRLRAETMQIGRDMGSADPSPQAVTLSARRYDQECSTKFSIETAANDPGAWIPEDVRSEIVSYYGCKAFAGKNPRFCDGATGGTPQGSSSGVAKRCKTDYVSMTLAQSFISRSPDAVERCKEKARGVVSPEKLSELCAIIMGPGTAAANCAKASRLFKSPMNPAELKECAVNFGLEKGDESVCPLAAMASKKELCLDMAAYRKAFEARDIKRCGGSTRCKTMMGQESCNESLARARQSYCRGWAAQLVEKEAGEAGMRAQAQLDRRVKYGKLLTQVGMMVERFEPKTMAGYEMRRASYYAVLQEFDLMRKRAERAALMPPK